MDRPLTAREIKALSEATGCTLMECKHALREADGDFEAARRKLLDEPDHEAPLPEEA